MIHRRIKRKLVLYFKNYMTYIKTKKENNKTKQQQKTNGGEGRCRYNTSF